MDKEGKPVTLVTLNGFKHEGEHYAPGDMLENVPPELATDLVGAGRAALATEEHLAAFAGQKAAAGKK
jgi:hypothetical protein